MNLKDLAKEFTREEVEWRAQTLSKKGDKALALAYIDARDVMNRLDDVCGPENWQVEYTETASGRVIGRIGIHTENGWVWKSDGAGSTAVEGEKGGISDALKRAAVVWGVGRYLYEIDAPWVPCKTFNGKFSEWDADPWDFVRKRGVRRGGGGDADGGAEDIRDRIKTAVEKSMTQQQLRAIWTHHKTQDAINGLPDPMQLELNTAYNDKWNRLPDDPALQAPAA